VVDVQHHLTGQALFQTSFLHAFMEDRYAALRALVDTRMSGEDLALNAVVQSESGKKAVVVRSSLWWWIRGKTRTKINEGYGLSGKGWFSTWTSERGTLVHDIAASFPRNPFIDSEDFVFCG